MTDDLRHDIDEVLKAVFIGLSADLGLDENGMVAIGFQGDVVITLEVPRNGHHIYFHSVLLHLTPTDETARIESAMALNLFRTAIPGCWIALDPETKVLTLCAALHRRLCTPADMTGFLEAFVAAGVTTRDHLSHLGDGGQAAISDTPSDGAIIFRG